MVIMIAKIYFRLSVNSVPKLGWGTGLATGLSFAPTVVPKCNLGMRSKLIDMIVQDGKTPLFYGIC